METRRRLVAAAFEIFAERGFYGSTVEDICDRAGFTRGAFYSNFSTKEELFFDLYAERSDRIVASMERAIAGLGEPGRADRADPDGGELDALRRAVEVFLASQPEDRQWYLINTEFTLHAVRHPRAAAAFAQRRADVRARVADLLARGLADLGRVLTMDVDLVARCVLAVHEGGMEQSYLEPDLAPFGHLDRSVLPVLLAALSTRSPASGGPAPCPGAG